MAAEYRGAMQRMAGLGNLEVWYTKMDVRGDRQGLGVPRPARRRSPPSAATSSKTRAKDRMRALSKLTREVDGKLRIVSEPPLIVPLDELVDEEADIEAVVLKIIADYRETLPEDRRVLLDGYRFVDAALKVVGVGSVGTRAFIVLMRGATAATRSSCRPRKRSARCSSPTLSRAPSKTRASASFRGSV